MGRVRGVVVEAAQFGLDAVGRELVDVLRLAVEEVDAAGQHRDRAAGVREQPLVSRLRAKVPREQQARHGARRVVRHLDHGREGADAERAQQFATSGWKYTTALRRLSSSKIGL